MSLSQLDELRVTKFAAPNPEYRVKTMNINIVNNFYIVETHSNFYIYDKYFLLWKEVIKGFSNFTTIGIYKDKYFYYLDERDSKIVYINPLTKQRKATQIELGLFFSCGERIYGVLEENIQDSVKELYAIELEPEGRKLKFQCNESIYHVQYLNGFFCIAGSHRFLFKICDQTSECVHGIQLPIEVLEMSVLDDRLVLSSQDSKQVIIMNWDTLVIEKTFYFQSFSALYPIDRHLFVWGSEDLAFFDEGQNRLWKQEHRSRIKMAHGSKKVVLFYVDTFHVISLKEKSVFSRNGKMFEDMSFHFDDRYNRAHRLSRIIKL